MDKPKKLILDYSKWICGEGGPHALGKGAVCLKNEQGFMCCLGMWSLQCGASEDELLDKGEPNEIDTLIPIFAEEVMYEYEEFNTETGEDEIHKESDGKYTTKLALSAIYINDDKDTTPEYKIIQLKELLASEGIELEVINKPDIIHC